MLFSSGAAIISATMPEVAESRRFRAGPFGDSVVALRFHTPAGEDQAEIFHRGPVVGEENRRIDLGLQAGRFHLADHRAALLARVGIGDARLGHVLEYELQLVWLLAEVGRGVRVEVDVVEFLLPRLVLVHGQDTARPFRLNGD